MLYCAELSQSKREQFSDYIEVSHVLNLNKFSVRANSNGPPLVEVFVDDIPVEVPAGTTVIQACAEAGIEIPRFAYSITSPSSHWVVLVLIYCEGTPFLNGFGQK